MQSAMQALNTTLQQQINDCKAETNQNKADINNNKADINENKADINENKADINENKADINENKGDIQVLNKTKSKSTNSDQIGKPFKYICESVFSCVIFKFKLDRYTQDEMYFGWKLEWPAAKWSPAQTH